MKNNLQTAILGDEEWRDVVGYEGLYLVSNYGRVRSLNRIVNITSSNRNQGYKARRNGRILTSYIRRGYQTLFLSRDGKARLKPVHRLVAMAFLSNPLNKSTVNHIDGNKQNNHVSNLEWATYSENELHSYKVLGKTPNKTRLGKFGKESYNHRIIHQLSNDGAILATYESRGEATRKTGISSGCIWMAMNGKRKTAGGFRWAYADIKTKN